MLIVDHAHFHLGQTLDDLLRLAFNFRSITLLPYSFFGPVSF
jgi:hypothetical protein